MDGGGCSRSESPNTEASSPPAAVASPVPEKPNTEPSERIDGLPAEWTPEIRRTMNRITVAGCLAMIYFEFTSAGPRTDLLDKIGASYVQFGVLEAIPPLMLLMQFLSGLMVTRLTRRKPLWIVLLIAQRVMAIPFALLPILFPTMPTAELVWCMIGCLALGEACANMGVPMWFSWMSDILPHRTLGEFWARRRKWTALSSTVSLIVSAGIFWVCKDLDVRWTYMLAAGIGATAGVIDILMFLKVHEPAMAHGPAPSFRLFASPFRDTNFRRFILYNAYWSFAATFGFAFFRLYMLRYLKMELWQIQMIFCFHAFGGVFFAPQIGRLVDRIGSRPIIVLCSVLKSLVVIGIFLAQPGWVHMLHLIPIFILDNILNTGMFVAHNNYMLRYSPRAARPMYVAAVLATSGLVGAGTNVLAGQVLQSLARWGMDQHPVEWAGLHWTNFHVVFCISILLRWVAIPIAMRIREPKAEEPSDVLFETIVPAVVQWLTFPTGFFSRNTKEDRSDGSAP